MTTTPETSGRNLDLESAAADAAALYEAANPGSRAHYERARESLPGGNTRTGMFYTPFPLAIEKAAGATLTDVDGHRYMDFVGDFSAGLYGHSHPVIREAMLAALDAGMAYGSASPYEERLAALVCARFPSVERVRFTNSGTEANTMALVTARAVTSKDAVMVFEGGYHGGTIYFGRKGAPINVPFPFVIAPYNDAEEAQRLIRENAARLAAVLVEPLQGASGAIPGSADFLRALREACTDHGVLLIFDEVMTSRLAVGGRQGQLDISPDMTTLGKYIGGGISCGAFGGPAEIMERYDPSKPGAFVHHGTFNNNVLMLRAGAAGLEKVLTPPAQAALNESGDALRDALNGLASRYAAPFQVTGLGSIMTMHFQREPVHSIRDLRPRDERLRQLLHLDLIDKGIFTTRRGYMALSLVIIEDDRAALIAAVDDFLAQYGHLLDTAPEGGSIDAWPAAAGAVAQRGREDER